MIQLISFLLISFLGIKSESKLPFQVKVEGIPSVKGTIRMGVYNSSSTFPKVNEQWKGIVRKVEGKSMTIEVDLPTEGNYAIAIYHDANGNGRLDKNMLGVPTEVYGFSNNARATFSAPSFSEAQFSVKANKVQTIRLQ